LQTLPQKPIDEDGSSRVGRCEGGDSLWGRDCSVWGGLPDGYRGESQETAVMAMRENNMMERNLWNREEDVD